MDCEQEFHRIPKISVPGLQQSHSRRDELLAGIYSRFPISTIKSFHYVFQEELVGIFGATSERDLGVLDQSELGTNSMEWIFPATPDIFRDRSHPSPVAQSRWESSQKTWFAWSLKQEGLPGRLWNG